MASFDSEKIAQNEENLTLQSDAEYSHTQVIDEILDDFQKDQDLWDTEQSIKTEQMALLDDITPENQTLLDDTEKQEDTPNTLIRKDLAEIAKIKNNDELEEVANKWIENCESLLDSLGWNRKSRKELSDKVNRVIRTDLLPMTEDDHTYLSWLTEYKNRLTKIVYDYYTNREPARQLIMMWGRVPVINWTADTEREAKIDNRHAKDNAEYQIDVSELKKNTALYTMIWVSAYDWGNYCDFIRQWWIATTHPVYVQHTAGFKNVNTYNPDVYRAITPKWQITYEVYCQRNPRCCSRWNNWYNPNRRYRTWTIWDDIASMIEDQQIKRGKEVNPQQREARRKIWNIWSVIWCVALGFWIIKELFPWKDKKTDRWRVLWLWAGIFGITHYKDVKKTFFDAFNLDPDNYVARRQDERAREEVQSNTWLSQSEANELINAKITYPTLVATTLWAIPINLLIEQKIVEEKDWKLVLNKTNYATYVENMALAWWRSDKDKQKMLDKIASDEAEKSISYGLSYCWINTLNDLANLKDSETSTLMDSATFKTRFGAQIDAIKNKTWIFSNMAKQWFIPVWLDETIEILEKYDSNKNENEQILERLEAWLLETNPERNYPLNDMLDEDTELGSQIDLGNMTMKWFTNDWWTEIRFDSYWDLFDTVRITKRIKDNFSWRPAKSDTPFHIDVSKWRIEFDDTERYEVRKNETDVIKNRTLRKTSSLLTKNKQFYVNYLNKWRKEDQDRIIDENKVDLSWYPILKDVWINFIDADEAHRSEQLLSKVKYELRNREKRAVGDAFEIKTTSITNKTNIEFITRWWQIKKYDITDYPTLVKNEKKLLQYINNPHNNMRGSTRP